MSNLRMDDRGVQIIKIAQKKKYSSLDYLSTTLGVGSRTIRNDIKQLNNELEGIALLKNEKSKGFRLYIKNKVLFESLIGNLNSDCVIQDSPKSRIAFIIDRLINSEETYTLDDLAFDMNLGRTTLVKELKKASVSLEAYNLKVQGKPNCGMHLLGKELDLRFFILDNIYDFLYGDFPLDQDIKEEIKKTAIQHDLEATTETRLMQFVIVMLDRLLKNQPLKEINEKYNRLVDTNDYRIAVDIAKTIEKQLPVKIPKSEILFITIPIAGRRTPTNNRTMAEITVPEDIKKLLELIVEQVGFKKEIIKENENFFNDLQYHLTFMLNRLLFGLRLKNPLLADVKEKYPLAYQLAEIAGQVIESNYDVEVFEDELGYIAFYFGVFISQSESEMRRLQRAAVICGTGRGTAKLVAIQLQRILKQDTKIDLFSEIDVTKKLLDDYDIIFSTVNLSHETETPVIRIDEIFDETNVSKKIEKATYLQNLKLKDDSNHNSIMRHLIDDEKFFLLDSTKNYQENVSAMVDQLVEKGYLDQRFKERLNEREQKGSMVFDNYIALPHTFNKNSNKIEVSVGVFPEKVKDDNKEISLVFLLGIPEEQSDNCEHLLVKIYDEIIKIANDKELIDKLASINSYYDFLHYLEESAGL